jgi:hypothetical protein
MRAIAIVALSAALSGCGLQADFQQPRHLFLPSKKCAAVAQQRMLDAAENGYEADLQKVVFDGAYADCAQWDAAHAEN